MTERDFVAPAPDWVTIQLIYKIINVVTSRWVESQYERGHVESGSAVEEIRDLIANAATGPNNDRALPALHVTPDTMDFFHAFSPGKWKEKHVWVHSCTRNLDDPMWLALPLCAPYEHDLYPMIHHGQNGERWPTGFLSCDKCMGTAHDPEGYA